MNYAKTHMDNEKDMIRVDRDIEKLKDYFNG